MYRTDGYRVKTNDAMYELVPYIMPLRYDASNSVTCELDLDKIQDYIANCRKRGIKMSHMSVIIAGYLRVVSQNPLLNRFCMNRKIYARNHFCVSFVTLVPGSASGNTVSKVYFNLDDDIFTVNDKIQAIIEGNRSVSSSNSLDKLMAGLLRLPFLPRVGTGILKLLDKYFTMPFAAVNASPFHTSIFITNLASIRTNAIYHHLYEFGTTGVFASMGQPKKKTVMVKGEPVEKKIMELGIVTDERIADGCYYGRCFRELNALYKNPVILETKPEKIIKDPDVRQRNTKFIVR